MSKSINLKHLSGYLPLLVAVAAIGCALFAPDV